MVKEKGTILVVDDEVYIREILKSTLEDAGYECVTVESAEAAITALEAQEFDIAFTDIRMPGKQGIELLQEIKAGYPDVVVIMITAIDNANTAIESMRLGAYDYIIKPFNLDQVLVSANRALDKRRLENANREYQKYLQQIADELMLSAKTISTGVMETAAPAKIGPRGRWPLPTSESRARVAVYRATKASSLS